MQNWFNPAREIDSIIRDAASRAGLVDFNPDVRPADPRFGDFQANGVLPYAKREGTNPRQLATQLVDLLKEDERLDPARISLSIAGPGFINFTLEPAFLLDWVQQFKSVEALAESAGAYYAGRKVLCDYPSPNTAKQMHVGHLRPMVIGEAIRRLIEFCGGKAVTDNHIGDWGTNFGTLIMSIKRTAASIDSLTLEDIELLYRDGSNLEKEQPELRDISRHELVKLQQGDEENLRIWRRIVETSNDAFESAYRRMGLHIDMTLGESYYRDKVEQIYEELASCGLAEESQGALVVFHPEHKRFATQPFIIRKADGASNYASTDLATILHRVEALGMEHIVYFTDGRQQDHFQQLFLTATKWFERSQRQLPKLDHVWWGTILGDDGKAIKTKSGEPIRLKALLDEAQERARAIVAEKNPDLSAEEQERVAEVVGIGAVRYADLSQNRTSDYVFSWDKMLSLEGNTAPYMLYAIARIHSIFRKLELEPGQGEDGASLLETPEEIALSRKLVALASSLEQTLSDLRPHFLCSYLYELAGAFSSFYNANRVMVDEPDVRARRLALCSRTLTTLKMGLELLGLKTLERM